MENVEVTILAQYAASPKLSSLIRNFNAAVSSAEFINTFYDLIGNIDTANTYGLDVWGKIVNVSRRLTVIRLDVSKADYDESYAKYI